MEEFPYYGLSWFFYLLAAAGFLLLCLWKTRKWSYGVRIPLLTFFAAMSLTPGITLPGESWYSPAAIIMIFDLDRDGFSGILHSALSIIAVWLILMLATFIARWQLNKRHTNKEKQPELIDPN